MWPSGHRRAGGRQLSKKYPTPEGSKPIAGGRAQRHHRISRPQQLLYPEGIPAALVVRAIQAAAIPAGIEIVRSRLSGGGAALTTGYGLESLRDRGRIDLPPVGRSTLNPPQPTPSHEPTMSGCTRWAISARLRPAGRTGSIGVGARTSSTVGGGSGATAGAGSGSVA